jgi:hypothetical protein
VVLTDSLERLLLLLLLTVAAAAVADANVAGMRYLLIGVIYCRCIIAEKWIDNACTF